jgi:hypothetical protein
MCIIPVRRFLCDTQSICQVSREQIISDAQLIFFFFFIFQIERKTAGPYSAPHTDAEMEAT